MVRRSKRFIEHDEIVKHNTLMKQYGHLGIKVYVPTKRIRLVSRILGICCLVVAVIPLTPDIVLVPLGFWFLGISMSELIYKAYAYKKKKVQSLRVWWRLRE